ncbi:MAG: hypothetical protein IJ806_00580 [Ruminococcus sp.]|nr:hypothetical protein [Ruminococcus sp.]
MKNILASIISVIMTCGLFCACGNVDTAADKAGDGTAAAATVKDESVPDNNDETEVCENLPGELEGWPESLFGDVMAVTVELNSASETYITGCYEDPGTGTVYVGLYDEDQTEEIKQIFTDRGIDVEKVVFLSSRDLDDKEEQLEEKQRSQDLDYLEQTKDQRTVDGELFSTDKPYFSGEKAEETNSRILEAMIASDIRLSFEHSTEDGKFHIYIEEDELDKKEPLLKQMESDGIDTDGIEFITY